MAEEEWNRFMRPKDETEPWALNQDITTPIPAVPVSPATPNRAIDGYPYLLDEQADTRIALSAANILDAADRISAGGDLASTALASFLRRVVADVEEMLEIAMRSAESVENNMENAR